MWQQKNLECCVIQLLWLRWIDVFFFSIFVGTLFQVLKTCFCFNSAGCDSSLTILILLLWWLFSCFVSFSIQQKRPEGQCICTEKLFPSQLLSFFWIQVYILREVVVQPIHRFFIFISNAMQLFIIVQQTCLQRRKVLLFAEAVYCEYAANIFIIKIVF